MYKSKNKSPTYKRPIKFANITAKLYHWTLAVHSFTTALKSSACCVGCRADPSRCNSTSRQNPPVQCRKDILTKGLMNEWIKQLFNH